MWGCNRGQNIEIYKDVGLILVKLILGSESHNEEKTNANRCAVCNGTETPAQKLVEAGDPKYLEDLKLSLEIRLSLGDVTVGPAIERLKDGRKHYHSTCRKRYTNKNTEEAWRKRHSSSLDSESNSKEPPPVRTKRTRCTPKEKVCVFGVTEFCCDPKDPKDLIKVSSKGKKGMGNKLIFIKDHTHNEKVRLCLSDLIEDGDAAAKEKWYHRNCLVYAKRTLNSDEQKRRNEIQTRQICDHELILYLRTIWNGEDENQENLKMNNINDIYLEILNKYQVTLSDSQNYKKYLKKLIKEHISDVQFVKPTLKNQSEHVVMPETISKAVDLNASMSESKGNDLEVT